MSYKDHPAFETPDDDTEIWRYTTLGWLIATLEKRALFFVRINKLEDPWEGSYPNRHVSTAQSISEKVRMPLIPGNEAAIDYQVKQDHQVMRMLDRLRLHYMVNCWCQSKGESESHWRTYGQSKEGVAIRSTVGRMKKALGDDPPLVFIGKIKYLDFKKETISEEDTYRPLAYKRLAFRHDDEVRAVVDERLRAKGRYGSKGGYVPVDLAALIQEVVLSPISETSLLVPVRKVVKSFGLACPVRRSPLLDPPGYRPTRALRKKPT